MKKKKDYLKQHCEMLLQLSAKDREKVIKKFKLDGDDILHALDPIPHTSIRPIKRRIKTLIQSVNEAQYPYTYRAIMNSHKVQEALPHIIKVEASEVAPAHDIDFIKKLMALCVKPLNELDESTGKEIFIALSTELSRELLYDNQFSLLNQANATQLFSCMESAQNESHSLFLRTVDDPTFRPFWERRLLQLTEEESKLICLNEGEGLTVVEVLLQSSSWHEFLYKEKIFQTIDWSEIMASESESLMALTQTKAGWDILLADDARLLREMPRKMLTPRFIVALFQFLDTSESLQKYLQEEASPLYQSLFEPHYDTIQLNVTTRFNVDLDKSNCVELASPAFQLAKSPFGRGILMAREFALLDKVSPRALAMGNEEDESPLFYLIDDFKIFERLFRDKEKWSGIEMRTFSKRVKIGTEQEQSLLEKVFAHPHCLQILLANDLHCLDLLEEDDRDALLMRIPHETLQIELGKAITSVKSFQRAEAFLRSVYRIDWLMKLKPFQEAIAHLFIRLLKDQSLPAQKFRLFTQYMGKAALNTLTPKGESVLSCLCQYKEGVDLIKGKKFNALLDSKTLDHTIKGDFDDATTLRRLLSSTCDLQFSLERPGSNSVFFSP